MCNERSDLKFRLLQIREDKTVIEEEVTSFAHYMKIDRTQIDQFNLFENPCFGPEVMNGVDALIVGGASNASVLEPTKYKFVKSAIDLMNQAISVKIPLFASCFGFQLAILALGEKIIKDSSECELGTYPIYLTEEAKSDPLFKNFTSPIEAISVHQERAIRVPDSVTLLGFSDMCPHAFKVNAAPFWAFQFHPELDRETLRVRLGIYKDKYTNDEDQFLGIMNSLKETPESNQLLENFVDYILKTKIS